MQVGFNPINFNQQRPNKAQAMNFGREIDVKHCIKCADHFAVMLERGIHEDSPKNRQLLKQVITGIKKRFPSESKWDIAEIKESLFEKSNWKKDDELKKMFEGY